MQRKKIKNKIKFIIGIIVFFLIVFLICIQFNNLFILDSVEIYTEAILGEKPGFDLNKTALTFGRVVPANKASRDINIKNDFDKKVLVSISSKGEISDFLIVSENDFVLMPNEARNLSFFVLFPKDAEMKKYTGWIEVKLKNV